MRLMKHWLFITDHLLFYVERVSCFVSFCITFFFSFLNDCVNFFFFILFSVFIWLFVLKWLELITVCSELSFWICSDDFLPPIPFHLHLFSCMCACVRVCDFFLSNEFGGLFHVMTDGFSGFVWAHVNMNVCVNR